MQKRLNGFNGKKLESFHVWSALTLYSTTLYRILNPLYRLNHIHAHTLLVISNDGVLFTHYTILNYVMKLCHHDVIDV